MKAPTLKTVLLLAAITFFNYSNNDDSLNELPSITQTGANTFVCIINGEVLVSRDGLPSLGEPSSAARRGINANYYQNNNFIIYAGNFRGETKPNIYNLTSTETYSFGLSNGGNASTFEPNYPHC